MSDLYNPTLVSRNTRATGEQVNAELVKIQSAFQQTTAALQGIEAGTGIPNFTWRAFADSLDGTDNFTTDQPGDRQYIGFAFNKAVETPSNAPADYTWARYGGGVDGVTHYVHIAYADSVDGQVNFTTGGPTGRAFIGIAANQLSPVESINPADYVWSLYRGPATFGLVAWNANAIVGPNFIQKIAGDSSVWGTGAYSSETFPGSAQLGFTAQDNAHDMFIGLNTDPTTDSDFASIDYGFFLRADGQLESRINGGSEVVHGPYSITLPMQIIYDGKFVRWFHDGQLLRQVAVAANISFYLDTSLRTIGGRLNNLTWSSAGKAGDEANFGIVAGANMTIEGARVRKVSGSYDWNAQIYSRDSFKGGAFLSWRPEIKDQMILGLNSNPLTDAGTSIEVFIYLGPTSWDCRINGVTVYSHPHDWVLGDTFAIHYTGAEYLFLKNGVICHTEPAGAGYSYYFDSSFTKQGLNATILSWTAAGAAGPPGSTGAQGDPFFGFVQDSPTPSAAFVQQTWYRPSYKELYRATATGTGGWARVLGNLSAEDLIANSAFIASGIILNAHIANAAITNAKIDTAAITSAKIGDLEVGSLKIAGSAVLTDKIVNNAVTVPLILRSGLTFTGNGAFQTVASGSISLTYGGTLVIQFSASHVYFASIPAFELQIYIGGVLRQSVGGAGGPTLCPTLTTALAVGAGTHNVEVKWKGDTSAMYIIGDTTLIQGVMK